MEGGSVRRATTRSPVAAAYVAVLLAVAAILVPGGPVRAAPVGPPPAPPESFTGVLSIAPQVVAIGGGTFTATLRAKPGYQITRVHWPVAPSLIKYGQTEGFDYIDVRQAGTCGESDFSCTYQVGEPDVDWGFDPNVWYLMRVYYGCRKDIDDGYCAKPSTGDNALATLGFTAGKQTMSGRVSTRLCSPTGCTSSVLPGVTVTATGPETRSVRTGPDGTWSLTVPSGTYRVKPSFQARSFLPAEREVVLASEDVSGVDFETCGPATIAGFAGADTTPPVRCFFHIDWQVPERFRAASAQYSTYDGVITPSWVNPASWPATLFVREHGVPRTDCGGRQYRWSITPVGGGAARSVIGTAGTCSLPTSFPREGVYRVRATEWKKKADGTFAPTGRHGEQEVVIQDWLIIGMGDSMASGEGNPDTPSAANPRWQSEQCHRSFASYQGRVASWVEHNDPHTSVTFIHTSCSGATVTDLYNQTYRGIEPGNPLAPQIEQVRRRLQGPNREVDVVLLSIGVNDLRFGAVIALCAGPTGPACMDRRVREVASATDPRLALVIDPSSPRTLRQFISTRVGIDLPARYRAFDRSLGGIERARVFAIAYPNLVTDAAGAVCTPSSPGTPVDWKGISGAEAGWIGTTGTRLNGSFGGAATGPNPTGWTFVGANEGAYRGHGYCSSDSWIQSVKGSFSMQGDHQGAMHPVGKGPAVTTELITDRLCGKLYRGNMGSCRWDPVRDPLAARRPQATGSRLLP